jgi:hypothetical protein
MPSSFARRSGCWPAMPPSVKTCRSPTSASSASWTCSSWSRTIRCEAPPVVDCEDILSAPAAVLEKLCAACGISFDPAMLSWPAGPKSYDGAWASHWYNAVWRSTGFGDPKTEYPPLDAGLQKIADAARPIYEALAQYRLTA